MDWRVGAVTVSWAVPLTPVNSAVIVTGPPTITPVARPWVPDVLLTVATAVFEDDHVTDAVRTLLLPSEY